VAFSALAVHRVRGQQIQYRLSALEYPGILVENGYSEAVRLDFINGLAAFAYLNPEVIVDLNRRGGF
jgi:hypothetical protein